MALSPYPVPATFRETDALAGDGGVHYGGFGFKIFDTDDVKVYLKRAGQTDYSDVTDDVTVAKVASLAFDDFTVEFASAVTSSDRYIVRSERLARRSAGVTKGTKLSPDAIELELSRAATQDQETERDLRRALRMAPGAGDGLVLSESLSDGQTLMKDGDFLVPGPDIIALSDAASAAASLAQKWAEGTLPSGSGTKSAKEWAAYAEAFAAIAQAVTGLTIGTTAGTIPAGNDSRIVTSAFGVASRTAIKALDTTLINLVYLKEAGREGFFSFKSGDYSAKIAADTREGLYLKADAIASTAGAWVRQAGWLVGGINADWFGDLNAALSMAAAVGATYVSGSGTYTVTATVVVPSGIFLGGGAGLTIKQGNAVNLTEIVNLGTSAKLSCVIDGNRSNNTDNASAVAIRIGNNNDVEVSGCVVKNLPGYGVVANLGLRAKIKDNIIYNFYEHGIACYGNNSVHAHEIEGNYIHTIGWGAIVLQQSDHSKIRRNRCVGQITGGRGARMSVNTSGTTVTWVSGPDFTNAYVGNFVIANNGSEYRISAIAVDKKSCTVETSLPTLSGIQAGYGSGDLCGIIATSNFEVIDNDFNTTATFGFGCSLLGSGSVQCGNGKIHGNRINYSGKNAINLNGVGGGIISSISANDNIIYNSGWGGGISSTSDSISIFISGGPSKKIENIYLANNTLYSYADGANPGQTNYWLGTDGNINQGTIRISGNRGYGMAHDDVYNDIISVSLSPGWGSAATYSILHNSGTSIVIQVNSAGSGQSSGANIVIVKAIDAADEFPIVISKIVGSSGIYQTYAENDYADKGKWVSFLGGAPVASTSYKVALKAA